jgi:hypothetical protein
MEGIEKDEYDRILGLKAKGLGTAVVAAVRYRAPTDKHATGSESAFPAGRRGAARLKIPLIRWETGMN